jgi:hypothetical protein
MLGIFFTPQEKIDLIYYEERGTYHEDDAEGDTEGDYDSDDDYYFQHDNN